MPVSPPLAYRRDSDDNKSTKSAVSGGTAQNFSRSVDEKGDSASVVSIADTTAQNSTHVVDEKAEISSIEKGHSYAWEGYQEEVLPDKEQGHYLRNLRFQLLNIYRRLFGLVFVTNMAVFIGTIAKGNVTAEYLGLIVVANLFCAICIRQDNVINVIFTVFCAVPSSWPLWIRRLCARVYSLGGIHSGCGISGVGWLIYFSGQASWELAHGGKSSIATVVIDYCVLLLLLTMVIFAYPKLRQRFHNSFERTHRFLGWTAVGLVWALVVLLTNDYRKPGQTLRHALTKSAAFWMVVVFTLSIASSWMRLRKRSVRPEVLSEHAVRLHMDYVTPVPGSFTRLSTSPLFEWHSFATMAEPDKKGYHSVIISRAGDWTSKMIADPPTKLWIRGIPTCGALRIVPMFRRVLLVATGSGIAPIAPHVFAQKMPIRLLWTAPKLRETFGNKLVDAVLKAEPEAVIYDTRQHGRPDMVKLSYKLARDFNAEAVCIISNETLTRKVVYGLMSRGIPAFGAIWDS
ncbi:hypothetical protein DFH11DRAFT_1507068 [Phellopilus nigrolimitatus]|nr:hypothetical protein DFH11DRAFT_1507068 [Phellopilus nigrolimitatus]